VGRVPPVPTLSVVSSGFSSERHGHVTVQMWEDAPEFTIVDVGTIDGLGT